MLKKSWNLYSHIECLTLIKITLYMQDLEKKEMEEQMYIDGEYDEEDDEDDNDIENADGLNEENENCDMDDDALAFQNYQTPMQKKIKHN